MDKMDKDSASKFQYISHSIDDTYNLAAQIAKYIKGGEVILLNGDLGTGKTAFTKGLALAMGVEETVTSPTFTFMNEYEGARLSLYHFDMYRAQDGDELYELGLNDYLYMDGVCVIEWNKFEGISNAIVVDIQVLDDGSRKFEISGMDGDICADIAGRF